MTSAHVPIVTAVFSGGAGDEMEELEGLDWWLDKCLVLLTGRCYRFLGALHVPSSEVANLLFLRGLV